MKPSLTIALCAFLAVGAQAQTPAKAPAGSTAQCNDGTYAKEAERAKACRQHGGVKTWLGETSKAVQTQSPAVTATEVAPSTSVPTRTPGTPENKPGQPSPAPRTLPEPRK